MKKLQILPTFLFLSIVSFSQDYAYYNEQAKKEYDNRNYYNAVDYATRSLNISPNGPGYWWRGMGRYYLNNYTDAAADFGNALSYYSSDNSSLGSLYYWRAICRYNQKNYKDAIPDFESAKYYDYEDKLNIYWYLGWSNYKVEEYKKAKELYATAITYASDNSTLSKLYKERADVERKLGEADDAMADYNKAIEFDSSNDGAFWNRALCRSGKYQYDLAIGDCSSAINILEKQNSSSNANDLGILYSNRGLYEYDLGKYDEAKIDLKKSLELNPNYDHANRNMADVLYALKQYKDANRYYLQAASLYKNDVDKVSCYSALYWSCRMMLNYTGALNYVNSAISMDPDNDNHYKNRAYVLSIKKDYSGALKDLNKVVAGYDKLATLYSFDSVSLAAAHKDRALLKIKMKDNTGALADLQRSASLDPNYNSYYELGRFFKQILKHDDLASVNLQKAAEKSIGKDTTSSYPYAKVIQGDKQAAIRIILKLIKENSTDNYNLKWNLHNATCIYALAGDTNKALQYLEKSLVAGFDDYDHLVNDRDLLSLVSLPQYKAILAKYKVPQPK